MSKFWDLPKRKFCECRERGNRKLGSLESVTLGDWNGNILFYMLFCVFDKFTLPSKGKRSVFMKTVLVDSTLDKILIMVRLCRRTLGFGGLI